MGKRVVGPSAERVGRRPRLAAGSQGAGPPSQLTRVRRASVHGQGLGRWELEALRGSLQRPAAAASPPDISFPGGSCTSAEPPNVLERDPCSRSPAPRCGWRRDPADRALLVPAQLPTAYGNLAAPSVRPRSARARLFSRSPPPGKEVQNRRSGPTCGVKARAPRSEFSN